MRKMTTAKNMDISKGERAQRNNYKVHGKNTKRDKGNIIKVGTWNLRSIYEKEAVRNVIEIMKQYKIHIMAKQ